MTEAREALSTWWAQDQSAASRQDQQRALWLRGRLALAPQAAQLDFQRLVVLYPGGTFTDRALLRLAQAAHAMGDSDAARAHVAMLVRDYPGSPARREAEAWLSAAGEAPEPPAGSFEGAAPGTTAPAVATTTEAPTTMNRDTRDAAPIATRPAPTTDRPAPSSATPQSGEFTIQLGAFGERPRAEGVLGQANAAGFTARLVRVEGSSLLHVRIGSFADRDEAQRQLDAVLRRGVNGVIVRDARPERPSGR